MSAQEAVFAHLNKISKELTEAVIDTVEYETACKNSHRFDWHEGFQPYDDMKIIIYATNHYYYLFDANRLDSFITGFRLGVRMMIESARRSQKE